MTGKGIGNGLKRMAIMLGLVPAVLSCIDEDLSKCPSPCTDIVISYVIEHEEGLDPAFSRDIYSVHTGFWTSTGGLYEENVLDREELPDDLTFAMTLPADDYDHIATVNCREMGEKHRLFPDDLHAVSFELPQLAPDTICAMSMPGYMGKLDIDLNREEQTQYRVPLHPTTAKLEIVLNHPETLSNIRCYVGGTKAGCMCWEESYLENDKLITVASDFAAEMETGKKQYGFYAFPTLEKTAKAQLESLLRRAAKAGEWKLYFLSDCSTTGKTIQHTFSIKEPLYAGEVFRGEFSITETEGEYNDVEAGIEVDTDWNPGGSSDVEM